MSQGVPSVTAGEIGTAAGLLGAGIGYILAPTRSNMEQLLVQKPDVFEKIISEERITRANSDQKNAYKIIVSARKQLYEAFKNNTHETKLNEIIHSPAVKSAYKTLKPILPKARAETAIFTGLVSGVLTMAVKMLSKTKN